MALALCCLFVAFLVLGGRAFAEDVCIIRGEMVKVALWLRANTPPGALVAAHDIGALGYFAPRQLVDLAGLVSPDVIPFMRDAEQLSLYILEQEADYLIVFPHWSPAYEDMVARSYFCPVWSAAEQEGYVGYSEAGTMTVYAIAPDDDCPLP